MKRPMPKPTPILALLLALPLHAETCPYGSAPGAGYGPFSEGRGVDRRERREEPWRQLGPNRPVVLPNTGVPRDRALAAVARIREVYTPVFQALNKRLDIRLHWEDEVRNAFSDQRGNRWSIDVYGGLVRHPSMTADGLMLILCHEVGHHLGGAPRAPHGNRRVVLSVEGQADYFATRDCLRRVWQGQDHARFLPALPDAHLARECQAAHGETGAALCQRMGQAALTSLTFAKEAFFAFESIPSYGLRSQQRPGETLSGYAELQCRLDTSLAGALCPNGPAAWNNNDSRPGNCGLAHAERPACWFNG